MSKHYLKVVKVCLNWFFFTRYPTTTGTSVLGVKFDGGVLMAADTLGQLYYHEMLISKEVLFAELHYLLKNLNLV